MQPLEQMLAPVFLLKQEQERPLLTPELLLALLRELEQL
jgi:hypothetical protein